MVDSKNNVDMFLNHGAGNIQWPSARCLDVSMTWLKLIIIILVIIIAIVKNVKEWNICNNRSTFKNNNSL